MEQLFDTDRPSQKIYTDKAIYVATFLGGPLIAGYLIAENFKAFDEGKQATRTWVYAILASVVIFGIIFMIPDSINIPNYLFPVLYTLVASLVVKRFQGGQIAAHIDAGGETFGWGRTILVSIIGAVLTVVILIGLSLLFFPDAFQEA